jgi:hypothetical protein
MVYRIKHWGGGLAPETAYRAHWHTAVAWAVHGLRRRYDTAHKHVVIQTKVDGEWKNLDWQPTPPQTPTPTQTRHP